MRELANLPSMREVEAMSEQGVRMPESAETTSPAEISTRMQATGSRQLHGVLPMRRVRDSSRRKFLRAAITSFGALGIWLMNLAAKRSAAIPENLETTVTVPWNAAHAISFHDQMIVVNTPAGTDVFSSRCTHLGCRINHAEGSELVCPCHGSRFNLKGEPLQGPARERLRALPFTLDRSNALIRVSLEG